MIACVDVDYRANAIVTACVGIQDWGDEKPLVELLAHTAQAAAPYRPGSFYLREMQPVADILATAPDVSLVVVDGYVWLAKERPGLGAHLYEHLGKRYPIAGVAKSPFRGNDVAIPVTRGQSVRPLFVTAVGIDAALVAEGVLRMHGAHRLPTILKRVDALARGSLGSGLAQPARA